MSYWTHICGVVEVSPAGRTQHENDYVLNTILDHLPLVTGSEKDMTVHVVRKSGHNYASSHDEFGMKTNNGIDSYGFKSRRHGSYEYQDRYMLVLDADLRDRMFEETKKEFLKWLTRLAKRIYVHDIVVKLYQDCGKKMILDDPDKWTDLFEWPSWVKDSDGKPAWWEYLLWDRNPKNDLPLIWSFRYINDPEIDKEIDRRREWHNKLEEESWKNV